MRSIVFNVAMSHFRVHRWLALVTASLKVMASLESELIDLSNVAFEERCHDPTKNQSLLITTTNLWLQKVQQELADWLTRIAIVSDRCKPKKCLQKCKKSFPIVTTEHVTFLFIDFHLHHTWTSTSTSSALSSLAHQRIAFFQKASPIKKNQRSHE